MTDRITLETRTGTEAAKLTNAAKTAKEAWDKSRTKNTWDFVDVCRSVADRPLLSPPFLTLSHFAAYGR